MRRRFAAVLAPSCLALVMGLTNVAAAGARPLVTVTPDPVDAGSSATIAFLCPDQDADVALGSSVDISGPGGTPTANLGVVMSGSAQELIWSVPGDWPGGTADLTMTCHYPLSAGDPFIGSVEVVAAPATTTTEAPTTTSEDTPTTAAPTASTDSTLPATPPGSDGTLDVSDQTVQPEAPLTLTATGYAPGTTVQFAVYSTPQVLGTATADDGGVATLVASLPAGLELGAHTVISTGLDPAGATRVLAQQINLVAAPTASAGATSPGNLPRTGSSSGVLMETGTGLLLLGAAALLARRRVLDQD